MVRQPAIKFRGKIYVAGPFHTDAINLAFSEMSEHAKLRAYERVADGKETIIFGFAFSDGSNWIESDSQKARKHMYGFTD